MTGEPLTPDRLSNLNENAQLRQSNIRLLRQLAEAKAKREELVRAVYVAARDAAQTLEIPRISAPKLPKSSRAPETAIVVLSDWQVAKRTPSYSSEICAARITQFAHKIESLTRIQRADHPVNDCRVYLLGDLVEGELIFPGQAHLIDASLYRQVLVEGRQILVGFIRHMLSIFRRVHVVGVIGNHGALGGGPFRKAYHPESNADAMLYETSRLVLQGDSGDREPRLSWAPNIMDGERKWYAVDQVGEKSFFLFHGDQVKGGFAGFPWYGMGKKLAGWRMGAVAEPFDYALSGHFHQPVRATYGTIEHWGSGSPESDNTYAAEQLAAMGRPTQWLLFTHPSSGVSAEYLVRLD